MKISLIGAGRIGSAIAFSLSKAGHDVTMVARGTRYEHLRRQGAIMTTQGDCAPVKTVSSLLKDIAYDLVIVTVPEHQIEPLLGELTACSAKKVLFMFNTFRGCDPYRAVVGSDRFAFGFPNMAASLSEQRLHFRADGPGMVTTLTDQELVSLFHQANLPAEYEAEMDAFLRSHVALAVPLFLAALVTWNRDFNLTWREARQLEKAWGIGFNVVKSLGHELKPEMVSRLARTPSLMRTAFLWGFSRSELVRQTGAFGPVESRWLLDDMAAAAPALASDLKQFNPEVCR
ncbi:MULTISPECIES: ketopantoate reductase family protein [unclassified Pantoea]|uniref:ketopantoate reductase family protein n=1 Tax=unclassified Pantoea TaxID=2630326 RepID=UPI00301E32A6